MIKQIININDYWNIIVFYSLDYNFFDEVVFELQKINFSKAAIEEVYDTMTSGEAKAVTCSKMEYHTSIVIFNTHTSKADYISSIVHEAEHIKQAMLKTYDIEDRGEAPAYTVGYLVSKMYEVFKEFL